jgi:hypothetical protein
LYIAEAFAWFCYHSILITRKHQLFYHFIEAPDANNNRIIEATKIINTPVIIAACYFVYEGKTYYYCGDKITAGHLIKMNETS